MSPRSLMPHVLLLTVAVVLALRAWTKEEGAQGGPEGVELWGGQPSQITKLSFESDMAKVTLEPKTDEHGQYYVGSSSKLKSKLAPDPHSPHEQAAGDEGPTSSDSGGGWTDERFIAADAAKELVEGLAPLLAKRSLGKLDESKLEDFGLDKSEGTLSVSVGGTEHKLIFGGPTPGGGDTYVKLGDTGDAYVISGTIERQLSNASNRLMQREFHAFEGADVAKVRVQAGDASRELLREGQEKFTWSSPDKPGEPDETASNWMTKVERLRVIKYVEKPNPPVQPADLVVRVDFLDSRGKPLGFFELARGPEEGGKPTYYARSEQTRWYANVIRSTAEQIEQDLASVLNP